MKYLKKILASALIFSVVSVSALAVQPQRGQREPPPKDPKVFDKRDKEPKRDESRHAGGREREKPKDQKKDKP
jgi:hypothetical protein